MVQYGGLLILKSALAGPGGSFTVSRSQHQNGPLHDPTSSHNDDDDDNDQDNDQDDDESSKHNKTITTTGIKNNK